MRQLWFFGVGMLCGIAVLAAILPHHQVPTGESYTGLVAAIVVLMGAFDKWYQR